MMRFLRTLCINLLFITAVSPSFAQGLRDAYARYARECAPEKLYLHVDRQVLAPGETLWLKGYLVNAAYTAETPLSNFIYVELLKDTLLLRVMLKRDEGGFSGHLALLPDLEEGTTYCGPIPVGWSTGLYQST